MKYSDIKKFTGNPTYSVNVPWDSIQHSLKQYSVDVDPDFQRGHVWTEAQQSAYVEFRIRGGMSGKDIYINNPTISPISNLPDEGVLVDGKQRITAAIKFMNNELPIFGGYLLDEIDGLKRKVSGMTGLHFIFKVNDLQSRAEVLTWYLELNSGGVVHAQEELDRVRDLLEKEIQNFMCSILPIWLTLM